MSRNSDGSFFDSKTILAIILVGVCWIAWQSYMKRKYPVSIHKEADVQSAEPNEVMLDPAKAVQEGNDLATQETKPPDIEKLTHFEDEDWSFDFSSHGMGIRNLRLKKYKDRKGDLVGIGLDSLEPIFSTSAIGSNAPAKFGITQTSATEFKGEGWVDGTSIVKIVRVKSSQYVLDTEIYVTDVKPSFVGISVSMGDLIHKSSGSKFVLPGFDHQEFFTYSKSGKDRLKISADSLDKVDGTKAQVHVAALGTQYFGQAIVDQSEIFPEFKTHGDAANESVFGHLQYTLINRTTASKIQYKAFAGPKMYDKLDEISTELASLVDFGMFSWIAKYILKMMKWFHSLLGNWGLAIILLTIIVRLIVLPFAMVSFKSMKNMQAIQPQIKSLREKYKEDQARLNQEMMLLMKTNKVNPLGGCLPMFLQFPVFIALYQVLGQSIELYQAPFALWIHDLSLKDPFYILPILMGITMFLQQKMTPSTMDPAQAKVLMFMPIIFTFFMVSLPSGLTLYIFISSLFGVLQQLYFMRDKPSLAIS
ncbi:MAG: membrane protein insertase YidC [Bdellovibrionales bacterium]|nr:membrane protein insertase YidC [Bdellovibrionales bacterium]